MSLEVGILFAVILAMVYLFLTEKLPIDLTAFLGLVFLLFAGYVGPQEAFAGFSSTAVITMLSIFILSGALDRTGLADMVGNRVHALVGAREVPLLIIIMLAVGLLSAFANNIAATAVLMPAVASIAARRTNRRRRVSFCGGGKGDCISRFSAEPEGFGLRPRRPAFQVGVAFETPFVFLQKMTGFLERNKTCLNGLLHRSPQTVGQVA